VTSVSVSWPFFFYTLIENSTRRTATRVLLDIAFDAAVIDPGR